MLMRFDPFREIDKALEQAFTTTRQSAMPMDAYRHGDSFVVHLDLPGVDPSSIDVSVEQNVMTIHAERHWQSVEGDEVVANERRQGTFTRQLFLGNALESDRIHASYENGVLTLTIPVAEKAKPRKIEIGTSSTREAITTGSADPRLWSRAASQRGTSAADTTDPFRVLISMAAEDDAMLDETTQLEVWWSTLTDDQKQAVLHADLDDIPGWIIASLVAANVSMANDPTTGDVVDIKTHAPQLLQEFIAEKREQ